MDESCYWMELLIAAGVMEEPRITALMQELNELTAITVASIRTVKQRKR